MTAETIAKALGGRKAGGSWMARCPVHDDREPSLAIRDADNGKVLVRCHAGPFLFTNFECSKFRSGIDKVMQHDPFYKKLPAPYRDHVRTVDRIQTLAMLAYRPQPYPGDVILLKPTEKWSFLDISDFQWNWLTRQFMHHAFSKKYNGWSKHIAHLHIYPVLGHHQSIMEGDNAKAMAHIIQEDALLRQKSENPGGKWSS